MKTKLLSLLLLVSKITLQLDGKDKIRIMCAIVALPPAESNFRSPQNFVFNVQLSKCSSNLSFNFGSERIKQPAGLKYKD